MKVYRKIMGIVVKIENVVLALSMLLVLVLTFGNVVARKLFQHSWGFTEEIVVAVFVLISLLGAGVAARHPGGLVNLSLVTDRVKPKAQKVMHLISTIICMIYSIVLTVEGCQRIAVDHTLSPILGIPKAVFWSFVVIGGVSLTLHLFESCLNFVTDYKEVPASASAEKEEN